MTTPEKPPGLRTFLEQNIGLTLDPELTARIEKGLGTTVDEPGRWAEVERHLSAMSGEDPLEGFAIVQPVFERLLDEMQAANPIPLAPLPTWKAGERAIVATRWMEGVVDNGGAFAIFVNGAQGFLPDAIEGYRLLGLDERADVLADLVASGFHGDPSDSAPDEFEAAWFALPDAEPARAAWITAHPGEFRR